MITHLEPDILEYEVRWALGSTVANKTSGGDMIPAELFKILRDGGVKVLYSICQQIWKTQQWPQDWKRSILIQIPKKGSTKECLNHWTITLISHTNTFPLGKLEKFQPQEKKTINRFQQQKNTDVENI